MSHELKVELVEHETAKSVVLGFFSRDYPKLTPEQILRKRTEFNILQKDDKKHKLIRKSVTVEQLLESIEVEGVWGYCDHKSKWHKEIHYWINKKATANKIIELLGHELAHACGYSNEKTAQKVGIIACIAYNMYCEDIKKEG